MPSTRCRSLALTWAVLSATSAAAQEPPATPPIDAGYQDGFFIQTRDERFRLKIRGLLQPRLSILASSMDVAQAEAAFSIRRAELELGGHIFTKSLVFALKLDSQLGQTFIKDAFVDYALLPGVLQLRAGQFKRPFIRQELTGDWRLGFADRSITNAFFGGGRDIGAQAHNGIEKSPPLEWAIGVFGGGRDRPDVTANVAVDPVTGIGAIVAAKVTNVPTLMTPTFVGRFGYNHGGIKGYDELDTEGTAELRFAVAGSLLEAVEIADGARGATKAEVDAIVKYIGIDASAAVFVSTAQTGGGTFEQEFAATGAHVQAGWLIAGRFHPGVRYDYVHTADDAVPDEHEITVGHTLLFFGEQVAWLVDASSLLHQDGGTVTPEWRLRTGVNLAF